MDFGSNELASLTTQTSAGNESDLSQFNFANFDFSNVPLNGGRFKDGKYPVKIAKIEPKTSEKRFDIAQAKDVGGNPYLQITFEVFAGECKGKEKIDRFMLTGKGMARLAMLASALGYWDKEAKKLTCPNPSAFLGKTLWITIVNGVENDKNGTPRERDNVAFDGLEPISAYPVPGAASPIPQELTQEQPAAVPSATPPWSN